MSEFFITYSMIHGRQCLVRKGWTRYPLSLALFDLPDLKVWLAVEGTC